MNTSEKIHSLRVAYENWESPERFESLCNLLKKYPCGIESIALFTSATHSPLTKEELTRRVSIIKMRMKELRKLGFRAGINILATIGHHEEDLDNSFHGESYGMTNQKGEVCQGSFCMNDQRYLNGYVKEAYTVLANAEPEFIWIDDDIRYGHMPIGFGCFCDGCIQKFNKDNNTNHTRETLTNALNNGDLSTRRNWLKHNSNAIIGLFEFIGKTVREIDDKITLGFMTGERYLEGYDFKAFANALSDGGKYEIMWRPGGGAYTDYRFDDIVEKSEEIGRQSVYLPSFVTLIHSEIENFPYQLLKKTPVSTALEAAWNMTSGCTGAAFNILPSESEEHIENIEDHLEEINRNMPLYKLLKEKCAGKQPVGICTAWRPDSQLSVPVGDFCEHYGGMFANFAREMFDFGLPQSYSMENAFVTLAHGKCMAHWDDSEIEKLLSCGLYMDVEALKELENRGFSVLSGFKAGKPMSVDARECYTSHPLNDGICGGIRNCRQSFHKGDAFEIVPIEAESQKLANIVDYHNNVLAKCCQGIFENKLGGRISVGGYYPFSWVSDKNKTIQLKRLMIYLSQNKLPSYVDSYCRIRNHTFICGENLVVALLNPTNQPLKNVRVAVKTEKENAIWYEADGNAHTLRCEKENGENTYRFVTIEKLPAYTIGVIEV